MIPRARRREPVLPRRLGTMMEEEALYSDKFWGWYHKSHKKRRMAEDDRIDTSESNARLFYLKNESNKCTFFAMMIGYTSMDGRALGDTELDPYKDAKNRKLFVPTGNHMKAEVSRRCVLLGIPTPSCKYWNNTQLRDWLKENVVPCLVDREWILEEEQKLFDLFNKAANEKKEKEKVSKDWGDNAPWLRLYSCLYDDRVRSLFLTKDQVMDRQELDARNHEDRPPTLWEAVAKLFNDPDEVYELPSMPELHHVYAEPISLSFSDMPGPITPEEAKRRVAEARAKLLRVIAKWELSGNGFGMRDITDDEYGHMEEEQLMDGDNRARFLDGLAGEHVLVLWDLGDTLGLLSNLLNKLSIDVAVDCENIHTDTSSVQNARRMTDQDKETKAFRDSLSNSMETMSFASLYQQLRESEDKIIKLQEQTWKATTEGAVDFYESCLQVEKERCGELKEELKRVKRLRKESNIMKKKSD